MDTWYAKHYSDTRSKDMASDRYAGYLARKQTHMVKLAMILAVAKRDDLILKVDDLEEAEKILADAEGSMIRVFETIGGADNARLIAEVIQIIRAYKFITRDELYRFCYNTMRKAEFEEALQTTVAAGLAKYVIQNGVYGLVPIFGAPP